MKKILNRVFNLERIDGDNLCPPYLYRWTLLKVGKAFSVYLHQFVGNDWARDPHDHPKRFISIGLWGYYDEYVFDSTGLFAEIRRYKAPWIRTFPSTHLHRIDASDCGNCWTLVITLKPTREWGFVKDGRWVKWTEYVFGGISRKSC